VRNLEPEANESLYVPLSPEAPAIRVSEPSADTFEALMERYQEVDQAAVRTLIERLSPVLLRFYRYQGARPDQAEDLVQDTWLRIHRVRHSYRSSEPLLPWVFAIARRVRIDHFRRNLRTTLREVSSSVLPDVVASAPDPESVLIL
jgi:RNA polymerase sigma-70 factor (ECF subfamily)